MLPGDHTGSRRDGDRKEPHHNLKEREKEKGNGGGRLRDEKTARSGKERKEKHKPNEKKIKEQRRKISAG